jgi:delta-aminolevulinic acid dehydratase/porphobilinogen synthase
VVNLYKILRSLQSFRKYVQTRVKLKYKHFTIHSDLVLCPSCTPGKVGIQKNDILIKNNGTGRG